MGLRTWLGLKKRKKPPTLFKVSEIVDGKEFPSDFTTDNFPTWTEILGPVRSTATEVLEIGSFEGRSALFFLRFLERARVTCVDLFPLLHVEMRFDANLAEFGERVRKLKGRSDTVMMTLARNREAFDVIYIDGDHSREAVWRDSQLAWPMLKPGGIMIWDDYLWPETRIDRRPQAAIDCFLEQMRDHLTVLHKEYQVIVRRFG
jgi:predicted O-methyltransferase YrrM